jgi:hypothetical protein
MKNDPKGSKTVKGLSTGSIGLDQKSMKEKKLQQLFRPPKFDYNVKNKE